MIPDMANPLDPLKLLLPSELFNRLLAASDRLGCRKQNLCRSAIEAVVAAVEQDDGLVLPIRFTPHQVPSKKARRSA
jgi:hypothetical protein